jgi:hypothetical protein
MVGRRCGMLCYGRVGQGRAEQGYLGRGKARPGNAVMRSRRRSRSTDEEQDRTEYAAQYSTAHGTAQAVLAASQQAAAAAAAGPKPKPWRCGCPRGRSASECVYSRRTRREVRSRRGWWHKRINRPGGLRGREGGQRGEGGQKRLKRLKRRTGYGERTPL